jgi:hypothetical protein
MELYHILSKIESHNKNKVRIGIYVIVLCDFKYEVRFVAGSFLIWQKCKVSRVSSVLSSLLTDRVNIGKHRNEVNMRIG